ncbi:protein ANTAGONIST OF LIKE HETEROCHROMATIN PROTEIN 1-like [Athalia rosae]|uniref:protein ANTAGONIST OF LIKE HETEROCHROMATIN PROTEIN 1-like n=1 Tax=Athalia rosae TaxID=37344 RepID=UPI0020332031|nr:protein ANTAGONIST OF LIKE HETEROCHROMATIN PROTEIN 1-like [Athalia rosae]
MRLTDKEKYTNNLRMPPEMFDMLLRIVGSHLQKSDIVRQSISASTRLALTLRYLASGDSMVSMSYAFRIGKSTVSGIISETCEVLWIILHEKVLLQPSTGNWIKISEKFSSVWISPNCIGAIDGKHVIIQAQPHSGSTNFNYKNSHSVILMAMCDADYCFTLVDIGAHGRQSDGGVFRNSNIGKAFENGLLDLPPPKKISLEKEALSYVMVADEAFSLTHYMLRPFPRASLTPEKRIFNYRLSRARRVIENAFGILVARWRIFRKPIICSIETTERIIKACVCLHNWLKKIEDFAPATKRTYCPPTFTDSISSNGQIAEGRWRVEAPGTEGLAELHRTGSNRFSQNASVLRQTFTDYFNNEGAVDWQWALAQNN